MFFYDDALTFLKLYVMMSLSTRPRYGRSSPDHWESTGRKIVAGDWFAGETPMGDGWGRV